VDVGAVDPHGRITDGGHLSLDDRLRVLLVQLPQIAEDEGGPRRRRSGEHVLGSVDAGQHQHRVEARSLGAGDVGVEPVADEERLVCTERATASSKIGRSGLPATTASLPTAVCTADTSVPFPGAMPRACGIVQSVFVAIHGMPPGILRRRQSVRGLGELLPAHLGREPLDDGSGGVVGAAGHDVARPSRLEDEAVSADDEDRRPGATRSRSRRIAACGLVTTSSARVEASPSSRKCSRRRRRGTRCW
jgi:hypothetical protein